MVNNTRKLKNRLCLISIKKPVIVMFSPGSSDVTSFLMTEARQHNTEIRLSVGKVADKVDQLASKVQRNSNYKNMYIKWL